MVDGLTNTAQQMFSRDKLRSISVFFGMGQETQAYSCLLSPAMLDRVRQNFSFFYLNYMVLTAALFFLPVVFSFTAWVVIGALAAAWIGMINSVTDERMLKVGSK
jgi:hypothetical protein